MTSDSKHDKMSYMTSSKLTVKEIADGYLDPATGKCAKEMLQKLTVEDVLSVYSGINGKCCCGCSGQHYFRTATQVLGGKRRGYAVPDEDVSDMMVKTVLDKIKASGDVENLTSCLSTVIGERLYIVYLMLHGE